MKPSMTECEKWIPGGDSFRLLIISRASTNVSVTVVQQCRFISAGCGCSYLVLDIDEAVYSILSTLLNDWCFC